MNSRKNEFIPIKYRLKIGDPNTLVVQGYFTNNKMDDNKLFFEFNENFLDFLVTYEEGIEVRRKYLTNLYGIDREYFFWIPLPDGIQPKGYIKVFELNEQGEKKKRQVISCSKLFKQRTEIEKYIDDIRIEEQMVTISGWYVSEHREMNISLQNEEGLPIHFQLTDTFRKDVKSSYPDAMKKDIHGIKIEMKVPAGKSVRLIFDDGKKHSEYWCVIHTSRAGKTYAKVKHIFIKTVESVENNGIQRTVKKVENRLQSRRLKPKAQSYSVWRTKHCPSENELSLQRSVSFGFSPKISIVVPLYQTPCRFLDELIRSVKNQTYTYWELCFSDGSGNPDSELVDRIKNYAAEDERIKIIVNKEKLQISENTNRAMHIATGDFVAFMDHDDLLTPDALYECVKCLNDDHSIDVIYSDEDKISMDGKEYFEPHFKTDFNIDLLCSMNYICHLFVVKRTIIDQIGLLKSDYDGAQDYDFIFRSVEVAQKICHIPKVLYHWRAHKNSTAENPESKQYAFETGARAVQAHYHRAEINAQVYQGEHPGLYRTKYQVENKPMISIIIPNKDHVEELKKCICSIEEKSKYPNYEYIIIENNSGLEETFQYYKTLEQNPKIKIVYWNGEFNFSAINNYGIQFARGEYLLFLNNDTEIINDTCLEELVGYCMRDEVGAVGARLYYEDDTIQHAGVIVGFGGIAGHAFIGFARGENGYFSRIICAQDLSAVTAACMMVKRKVFEEIKGFDERLKVAFNDIDLCMKIRKAGYLIVYNPYAELYHYESKSRGLENTKEKMERFNSEITMFAQKWPEILENGDPYYNPNLSTIRMDFGLK